LMATLSYLSLRLFAGSSTAVGASLPRAVAKLIFVSDAQKPSFDAHSSTFLVLF
jgi:hypothetical protein